MVVIDVGDVKLQIVRRRGKPYVRLLPFTVSNPSMAQAEARLVFNRIASLARRLSAEEVARIVGGAVYKGNLIVMPDGRVLPKAAALVAHYMRGYNTTAPRSRMHMLRHKWRMVLDARRQAEIEALVDAVARAASLLSKRRRSGSRAAV